MLFKLKSCRAFAALVGLFLLVVQVVAVPPRARKFPLDKGGLRPKLDAHKAAHKDAMHTHLKAKDAHIQVHHAHKSMAIQHEIYAMGLRTPLDRPHHAAAKKHREKAENHLVQAASHRSEAERHGTTGRVQSSFSRIAQSKHEGEKSIKNAQFLLRHGALLDSNMKAANEHRIAFTNHHEAGLLANALGHPGTTRYHVEQKTRHGYLAGVHAKLAKDNVKPTYTTLHTADEGIRHARASANDARHSNQIAHNSMQRTMVALPDSFWPRPAQ